MIRRKFQKILFQHQFKKKKKKNDNDETIIYKLKFIDSFRFMSNSLSSLVDNLSEIYKKECELCKEGKIMSKCRLIGLKKNELYYKCKECNDDSYKSINGLIEKFPNVYQFCKGDLNKFVLLLRKGVYPYETGIARKNLMKYCPLKKHFTAN